MPPFEYAHPDELLELARAPSTPPLLVALDGVTDPRNLGAVVRSAAAFGAHGVVLPQRRSASHDGGGVADQRGHRGQDPDRDGHEPDPHAARLGGGRA